MEQKTEVNVTDTLFNSKIVAILRGDYHGQWLSLAEALKAGGVTIMEITLNSPGALDGIGALRTTYGDQMLIGAGTVLSVEETQRACDVGAQFIVAPDTDEAVIGACHQQGVPVIPGAYTATEIKRAYLLGAVMVKLFPATTPEYVNAVHAPLGHIPLMPTGGVNAENAAEYMQAGAAALGVGSLLTKPSLSLDEITARARKLVAAVGTQHG